MCDEGSIGYLSVCTNDVYLTRIRLTRVSQRGYPALSGHVPMTRTRCLWEGTSTMDVHVKTISRLPPLERQSEQSGRCITPTYGDACLFDKSAPRIVSISQRGIAACYGHMISASQKPAQSKLDSIVGPRVGYRVYLQAERFTLR